MRFPSVPVNPTAFHVIDTAEKAYLIGFLLADGCIREPVAARNRYRVNLRILAQDIKVCQMVQRIAGGHLRLIEDGYRVEWDITSDALAADLIALGVTPRKSITATLRWDLIPIHLHGAVLAGIIDGDGHLRFSKKDRRAEISLITASSDLRDQLLERFPFFKSVVHHTNGSSRKRDLYQVVVETNRTLLTALITNVYDPLPFPILDRKQPVLDAIRGYLAAQVEYDRQLDDVPRLKACGLTIVEIAAKLGTSRNPICKRLKDEGIDSRWSVFTDEDRQEMMRLHAQGMPVLKIHAAIGKATEQAVRYQLQSIGCITKTSKVLPRHEKADEILRMHHEGIPAYRIADQIGMRAEYVGNILRRDGVVLVGGSPKKLTHEMVVWADGELTKGRKLHSVANELGVSGTLVKIRRRQMIAAVSDSGNQNRFR